MNIAIILCTDIHSYTYVVHVTQKGSEESKEENQVTSLRDIYVQL